MIQSSSQSHVSHVMPLKIYFTIFGSLLVLTLVTVWAAFVDLGWLNTPVALAIAIFKATLIILYFMHVRYSSRLTWVFAGAGFYWLLIFFGFTLSDYLTRGWIPVQ